MIAYHDRARRLIALRSQRNAVLGKDLFGDPAWDILLDIYDAEGRREELVISSISLLTGIPQSTTTRWLAILQDRGLILRIGDDLDGRRTKVTLSPAGRQRLEKVLGRDATASA
jgi:DNA-binding MarR family transcriptional regulator